MYTCTHPRWGEGHGRCESRKAEIGDTGLRICSVLNQDVALRRDDIGLTKLIPARSNGATDADNSPLQIPMDNSAPVKV